MAAPQLKHYAKRLEESYSEWESVHKNGCSDPSWADGVNLNLIRNHIIHYKQQLEMTLLYQDLCSRPLPPEVDNNYVARADEIRTLSAQSLENYKRDSHYQFLNANRGIIPKEIRNDKNIDAVLGYVRGLEYAIRHDDLVAMRRHREAVVLPALASCAQRVLEAMPSWSRDTRPKGCSNSSMESGNCQIETYRNYVAASPLLSLLL